jgi:rhamnulokinase
MAASVFLGIDLGAESGRVVAGRFDGRRIQLEELHRFPNGPVELAGSWRWDVLRLWAEIQKGLSAAARFGTAVTSVGVDAWGVDYVLLSKSGELVGQPFHYRDPRTTGVMHRAAHTVSRADIFAATGVQFLPFNTLYQLIASQERSPELLANADRLLLVPDFFHWCLCGSTAVEFTNATTTQFFNPTTRDWAFDLLTRFGLPTHMLGEVVAPGTQLGRLRPDVRAGTGLSAIPVVAPATHDTGSAVAAVPTSHTGHTNWAYISSGTWSLVGVELSEANVSPTTLARNLTNEGGVDGTYRLLKNVMGLWLVQRCRLAFQTRGGDHDYETLMSAAESAEPLRSLIDPDDPRFLNPHDMLAEIAAFCGATGQVVPETVGQFVRCCLESLALKYQLVLGWLEEVTGTRIEVIHIVGGGSRNRLLNRLTASACGRPVCAGPVEATAIGNVLIQARTAGELNTLADGRAIVGESFPVERFDPLPDPRWSEAVERFDRLTTATPGARHEPTG